MPSYGIVLDNTDRSGRGRRHKTDAERFWAKVNKTDTCWVWTSNRNNRGYGLFKIKQRGYVAHVLAYETLIGFMPAGTVLDHLCRTPSCVNPAHLEPVPPGTNTLRGESFAAVNARKETCPKGHAFDRVNIRGGRECSICKSEYDRARYLARKPR